MSIRSKVEGMRAIWQFDNRWELLFARTLFRDGNLKVYRINGMELLVDHGAGDPNGARHVLTSSMYRKFLGHMELNNKALNVLDLGANGGGFPLMLHADGMRLDKLVCVELNPNTFSRLRFNVERNLRCEFKGLNAAVCGERRRLEIELGTGSTADSIYAQPQPSAGSLKRYSIEGLTFDDIYTSTLHDEIVDICKMDIEGAEYEVFAAAHHECVSRCRYLLIEIHRVEGRQPEEVVAELKRCGFEQVPVDSKGEPDVYLFGNARLNGHT